jgi:crotonobetainyl-CoA:carnitine CoA-transferase CaiB-like acyl-CoA transferase
MNNHSSLTGSPLTGVRVLDFSHVLAGPMCTRLLSDLGADVLRIESTKRADTPWRSASDPALNRTLAYVMAHRGKKSMTIDLKSRTGSELAKRLAAVADVVVENFSADVMRRLGLDYDCLSPINPRLIFLSMSGYGHDGPRKDWTSMNTNLQAYSGMMTVTEKEGNPPVAVSNSWMDYVGGLSGCFMVMQALVERQKDGKGRNLDLAQFEGGVGTLGSLLLAGIVDGALPQRMGNRSSSVAPQECYRCAGKDEWCAISVEDGNQWQALAKLVGGTEFAHDARFQNLTGRIRNHDEIDKRIEDWTHSKSPLEVEQQLRAVGVKAQRMLRMNDVMGNLADSVFHLQPGTNPKPTLLTGLPFHFVPRRPQEFGKTPRLGEHTEVALATWLGLDTSEVKKLQDSGVLS